MIKLEKYTQGSYIRPDSVNTDPAQKDDKYDMQNCQYFYHKWLTGGSAWSFDYRNKISENRAYWKGEQDPNIYKSYIYGNNKNSKSSFAPDGTDIRDFSNVSSKAKRSALKNINFNDIVSPAPYIRNAIQGMFMESDRKIKVKMTDINSMNEEERKKWQTWTESFMKGYIDQMYGNMNAENPADQVQLPTTMEELEMMEFNGMFRLNYAKEAQKLLGHTENISEYADLYEKFIDDFAACSVAVGEVCGHTIDGKAKYEYVDPENSTVQFSEHSDYNDAEWGFTVKLRTISELADMDLSDEGSSSTINLKKIAKKYSGKYGNYSSDRFINAVESGAWLNYKVPVLKAAWKDIDVKKEIKYTRKRMANRYFFRDVTYDFEEKDLKQREELIVTHIKKIRVSNWIIDTDFVFGNGVMHYMVHEDIKEPQLPFRAIRLPNKPLVESIKPFLDDFHISWLWYQNAKAIMRPYGIQVNFDLLKGIATENGNLGELEALDMLMKKGILPVSLINSDFIPGTTTDQVVRPIDGGMGAALQEIMTQMNMDIQMISRTTGININSLEGIPDEGANPQLQDKPLVGVSNALKPLIDKTIKLKERLARYALQSIILLIKYDEKSRKAYSEVIGDNGVSLLREACAKGSKMGAYLDARPLAEDKREILEEARIALANGRDGKTGIEQDDIIYIRDAIGRGQDIGELRIYLSNKLRKREQELREREAQNQQANAKIQQDAAAMKFEAEMQTIQAKAQAEIMVDDNKYNHEKELERIKNGLDDRNDRKRDLPPPPPME